MLESRMNGTENGMNNGTPNHGGPVNSYGNDRGGNHDNQYGGRHGKNRGKDRGFNVGNNRGNNGSSKNDELKPPKVGRKDGLAKNLKGAPEDVRLGVMAWLSVSSMQAMYAVVQFVANIVDPRALTSQIKESEQSMGSFAGAFQDADPATQVTSMNLSMLIWLLFTALLCAWLTLRAGRGAPYSRVFLNVGSVYLALQAVLLLFSDAPSTMPVGFVLMLGILNILSGVAALLGMWFFSRPGNAEWLGIPPMAELEKYAEAVERRRKEEKAAKKAAKEAREREAKEKDEKSDATGPRPGQGDAPNDQQSRDSHENQR